MIILADNQDITRVGMMYVCEHLEPIPEICRAADKTELIEQLKSHGEAVVVLDYTLFDINDIEELEILHERFPLAKWILFSFDLSSDFVRRAIAMSSLFSVLLKDSPLSEIRDCLRYASRLLNITYKKTKSVITTVLAFLLTNLLSTIHYSF